MTSQCISYSIEYRNATLFFKAQEEKQQNPYSAGIAARTFSLLSTESSSSTWLNPMASGTYLPLSTPAEAVLTIWQTLQPTTDMSLAERDFPDILGRPRNVSDSDVASFGPSISMTSSVADSEFSIYSSTELGNAAPIWSNVRLFIHAEVAPISAVLHPTVWASVQDNLQTSSIVSRAPPLRSTPIPTMLTTAIERRSGSRRRDRCSYSEQLSDRQYTLQTSESSPYKRQISTDTNTPQTEDWDSPDFDSLDAALKVRIRLIKLHNQTVIIYQTSYL